jgi:hypothetical protein
MWQTLKMFKESNRQTKFFIFTLAIYMIAIFWTTIQAYARLEYSRTGNSQPIVIHIQPSDHS